MKHGTDKEYLVVTTQTSLPALNATSTPERTMIQIWSLDTSKPSDLARETTTGSEGKGMKLEMGLLVADSGEVIEISWRPRTPKKPDGQPAIKKTKDRNLGILGAIFSDGSFYLFQVPDPEILREQNGMSDDEVVYIHSRPLVTLKTQDSKCLSFDWASEGLVAVGCSNGWVATWRLDFSSGVKNPFPLPGRYFSSNQTAIRSVAWQMYPSLDWNGIVQTDEEPTTIMTVGMDGDVNLLDVRDPIPICLNTERSMHVACVWNSHVGGPLFAGGFYHARYSSLHSGHLGTIRSIVSHRGPIWSIASSSHHPIIVTASADGSCILSNVLREMHRKIARLSKKVFRLDFNRFTGEVRFIDNIKPEKWNEAKLEASKTKKAGGSGAVDMKAIPAWPLEIGIHRVALHPSIRRHSLLASGTALGLVRIDWIEGPPGPA